jgi:hypothetical protein
MPGAINLPALICPFVLTADMEIAVTRVTTLARVMTNKPSTKINKIINT